jgi:hypothetical protein
MRIPVLVVGFAILGAIGSIPASMLFVVFHWIRPTHMWAVYRESLLVASALTVLIGLTVNAFGAIRHRLDEPHSSCAIGNWRRSARASWRPRRSSTRSNRACIRTSCSTR